MSAKKLIKSAKLGDAQSQYELAVCYATGDGVELDLQKSRFWYEKSAIQGDGDAAFNLAAMWLHGEGGVRSKKKAIQWFKKAAKNGSSDADVWLGEKELSQKNFGLSCKYFLRAALKKDVRGIRGIAYLLALPDLNVSNKKISALMLEELIKQGVAP